MQCHHIVITVTNRISVDGVSLASRGANGRIVVNAEGSIGIHAILSTQMEISIRSGIPTYWWWWDHSLSYLGGITVAVLLERSDDNGVSVHLIPISHILHKKEARKEILIIRNE